jgi:hypothetical protein
MILVCVNIASLTMFYLFVRVEVLKWIFINQWSGQPVTCIRNMLFGPVNESKFRKKYMNYADDAHEQE